MTEYVQVYYEYTMNISFIYLHVNPLLCHSHLFGDNIQSSPQKAHGHSHYMFVFNIYRHGGCYSYTHPALP